MTASTLQTPTSPTEFRMPSLGADMEIGTVVAWRVKPGDRVKRGDIVAEVETEKGVFEVEIGTDGVIGELIADRGAKVPVGAVIARIDLAGASGAARPAPAVQAAPVQPPAPPPSAAPRLIRASPIARRIAEARGIDLATITGTGRDGVITKADVESAVAGAPPVVSSAPVPSTPPAPPSAKPVDLSPMRHAVAMAVARSKREIPHYYLATDINLGRAFEWLSAFNAARGVTDRVLPAALLLRAVALALRQFPILNGFWIDGAHRPADAVHLGIAISLRDGGLIAPAIHEADRLPLEALMRALSDLVARARRGGLRSSEMTDPTITVSSLGDQGAASVFGVIYPPQVALVGFGGISDRPWAEHGLLGVRPVVTVTLAADHRATDGHYGSRFLAEVNRLLQAPESL